MILSHRIALDPTVEQSIEIAKACGVKRFTHNWALDEWNKQYEAGLKPTANKLKKEWNRIKGLQYPWVYNSPKDANQQPFSDLSNAFNNFFKGRARYPRRNKRGRDDSFYLSNDKFFLTDTHVSIPHIGDVRLTEALRFEGKIMSATVSKEANKSFISITVEMPDIQKKRPAEYKNSKTAVGLDLGIKTAVVCSDGETFEAPKPLKAKLALLKRRNKAVSRKVKKSKNRWKAVRKLAKVHADVKNIRQDWIQKVTTKIARKHHTVCLEDLNVAGMMKNHKLARAISDIGFYEIRRKLEYKVPLYGGEVKIISRWEPSTKRCSNCGSVKDTIALSERVFDCPKCGFSLDRDLNAARNIMTAGLAVTACGPKSAGNVRKNIVKLCRDEAGTRPRAQSFVPTN